MSIRTTHWFFVIILFFSHSVLEAQDSLARDTGRHKLFSYKWNSDYFLSNTYGKSSLTGELGGNGGVYSINFQHVIYNCFKSRYFWSAGLSVMPRGVFVVDFPLSVNWQKPLYPRHHLILGTGQTLILSNSKGGYIRGTCRVAYRFNFIGKDSFLEFGYTPFYSYFYNFQWDHWVGIAFGWNIHGKRI